MYEFEHEIKRKEKIFKTYVILFIVSALINLVLFFMDGELLRGTISLLFYFIVVSFALRKKAWAVWIIKYMVWLHIIYFIIIIIAKAIEVMN